MPGTWASLKKSGSQDSSVFGADNTADTLSGPRDGSVSRESSPHDGTPYCPDGYVVTGAPPPCGQGAPKTPNEFLNVNVACTRKSPDATGKEVIWYDMTIRTTSHQWSISKRFSDFTQFHETLCKLRLNQYLSELMRSNVGVGRGTGGGGDTTSSASFYTHADFPPPFPSKFHLRNNCSPALVEDRRMQLDAYWKGVLKFLQSLTLAAIGVKKAYSSVLRSAFSLLVDFLRSSSQTERSETGLWAKDDPYAAVEGSNGARAGTSGGSPDRGSPKLCRSSAFPGSPIINSKAIFGTSELEQQPPCKLILDPNVRFTIVFFLPGVLLGDVYVDATGERDRSVIVGGVWNQNILGIESLKEQGVFQSSSVVAPPDRPSPGPNKSTNGASSTRRTDASGDGDSPAPTPAGQRGRSLSTKGRSRERVTLMDTLPRGQFELIFDVPHPFERAHWYSEYEGGVLLIMWDAP